MEQIPHSRSDYLSPLRSSPTMAAIEENRRAVTNFDGPHSGPYVMEME